MAFFPLSITSFPDLHHDAILVPFVLLTAYYFYRQRYVRAGIFFGLALASKNSAIILAPALLAYTIWQANAARSVDATRGGRPLIAGIKGWGVVMLLGALVLTPFANPISVAKEILTPITQRKYDPRGEVVSNFTVAGRLQENREGKWQFRTTTRHEVRLTNALSGFRDVGFLFIGLALLTLFSQVNRPLARMCLLILILSVPFGLIFRHALTYRTLLFVPFFAILAVHVARKGPLLWLVAALLLIDIVYCIDPITIDMSHIPANSDTFFSALSAGLGAQ
jgi:hypothetical protein